MTPFSLSLKIKIETGCDTLLTHHPLFTQTRQGHLKVQQLAFYVYNVKHMVENTPRHMAAGLELAMKMGLDPCVKFFRQKLPEEEGHDIWANEDLARMPLTDAERKMLFVCPSIKSLNHSVFDWVRANPAYYAAYALWAEYATVLITPRWVKLLETACALPAEYITILTKHVALDEKHALDDLALLDEWVSLPGQNRAALEMRCAQIIDETFELYAGFCASVAAYHPLVSTDHHVTTNL